MTHEERLAAVRQYNRDRRDYCKIHHLCMDCKEPIDADGTSRRCSFCRKKHNLLQNENRKTWSDEKREHTALVQKRWRFNHPEYFKTRRAQHEENT